MIPIEAQNYLGPFLMRPELRRFDLLMLKMLNDSLIIPLARIEREFPCCDDALSPFVQGDCHDDWNRCEIGDGYSLLTNVPRPFACFDALHVGQEFIRDRYAAEYAADHGVTQFGLWLAAFNQTNWSRLWSIRHSDTKIRREFRALYQGLLELNKRARVEWRVNREFIFTLVDQSFRRAG
jgi:hypothetical protein